MCFRFLGLFPKIVWGLSIKSQQKKIKGINVRKKINPRKRKILKKVLSLRKFKLSNLSLQGKKSLKRLCTLFRVQMYYVHYILGSVIFWNKMLTKFVININICNKYIYFPCICILNIYIARGVLITSPWKLTIIEWMFTARTFFHGESCIHLL